MALLPEMIFTLMIPVDTFIVRNKAGTLMIDNALQQQLRAQNL